MNGPATGGWTTWGLQLREDLPKKMYDDGSNGDAVAGDSIFTVTMAYAPDSTGSKKFIGQEYTRQALPPLRHREEEQQQIGRQDQEERPEGQTSPPRGTRFGMGFRRPHFGLGNLAAMR